MCMCDIQNLQFSMHSCIALRPQVFIIAPSIRGFKSSSSCVSNDLVSSPVPAPSLSDESASACEFECFVPEIAELRIIRREAAAIQSSRRLRARRQCDGTTLRYTVAVRSSCRAEIEACGGTPGSEFAANPYNPGAMKKGMDSRELFTKCTANAQCIPLC